MTRSILFLLALLLAVSVQPTLAADLVDRNVAIVNNDTITLSEVNEFGKAFFQEVAEKTPADHLDEAMQQARYRVIGQLIDQRLMLQEAAKYRIEVSDEEVEAALQRILSKNQATMEQFRKELAAAGMNERQYRQELRQQVLGSKLINVEIRYKVVIPEETIRAYYNAHYTEERGEGGKYHVLQIGCVWDRPDRDGNVLSQSAAEVKIEKIRQMVLNGKDFSELARLHSDMPSAAEGGDLGVFRKDEMAPSMQETILALQPGQVSKIVEMDDSVQFFKLISGKKGELTPKEPYEEVREKIYEQLYGQEMEKRFQSWVKGIRTKAYIKVL